MIQTDNIQTTSSQQITPKTQPKKLSDRDLTVQQLKILIAAYDKSVAIYDDKIHTYKNSLILLDRANTIDDNIEDILSEKLEYIETKNKLKTKFNGGEKVSLKKYKKVKQHIKQLNEEYKDLVDESNELKEKIAKLPKFGSQEKKQQKIYKAKRVEVINQRFVYEKKLTELLVKSRNNDDSGDAFNVSFGSVSNQRRINEDGKVSDKSIPTNYSRLPKPTRRKKTK